VARKFWEQKTRPTANERNVVKDKVTKLPHPVHWLDDTQEEFREKFLRDPDRDKEKYPDGYFHDNQVLVRNLPDTATAVDVRSAFEAAGLSDGISAGGVKMGGRKFAYVRFKDKATTNQALHQMAEPKVKRVESQCGECYPPQRDLASGGREGRAQDPRWQGKHEKRDDAAVHTVSRDGRAVHTCERGEAGLRREGLCRIAIASSITALTRPTIIQT
jgi:hypothetical protein